MTEEQEEAIEEFEEPLAGERAFYNALWGAQMDAPRIIKAEETFQGPGKWKYASAQTYMRLLVPVLLDWGLVFTLDAVGPAEDLELTTERGGIQWMTSLECIFRLTHADTGHSEVYRIRGRRTNDTDKGISHAISSATKTWFQRVLQVADDEAAPPNPVQESQASRPTKHGGAGPRKPQRESSPPPPENEKKPPSPPPSSLGVAQRLEMAKDTVKALLRKNHLRVYHLEALAEMVPDLSDELTEWGLDDYELVQKILETDPDQCDRAMHELAKEYPSEDSRKHKLHTLQRTLIEQGDAMTSEEQVLTATAHHSNWNDAVEFWIDKLSTRLAGQQEADL